jgi:hypothetical protein
MEVKVPLIVGFCTSASDHKVLCPIRCKETSACLDQVLHRPLFQRLKLCQASAG